MVTRTRTARRQLERLQRCRRRLQHLQAQVEQYGDDPRPQRAGLVARAAERLAEALADALGGPDLDGDEEDRHRGD
jgi:hypothetical protein